MSSDANATISSYLGQKGYTIYKEAISIKEHKFIREELTVRPFIPKSPVQMPSFPIYRESKDKFYIPRHFGEEHYGEPDESRISEGDNINILFNGGLRDYQENISDIYMKKISESKFGGGGLLDLQTGMGKTVIALNIISRVGKKALIIVHKGFLLNQWVERIQQYLPTARVGRIQGQILDIDDKDIVIGMLQSLSMKDYPSDLFKSFGITVVDEVHHISSEVFSRSLLKIVTRYTLGLSATMQRKDGLTKVFKHYLGDILFKTITKRDDKVIVKAIEYKTNDEEFNEVELDYRGTPKFSTMITKLCRFNHRSEYIVNVIKSELGLNPNQQMIILAHNKNLLTYLHDAIEHRNIATVGYYVGGMKEDALKKSETKQVIIATYAMASEGLDIPSLTTLLFATPKTDITQSVGRILRTKHTNPLVIDIIDQHEIFKQQWSKRKAYYIKNKYKIIQTHDYLSDDWKVKYDPDVVVEKKKKHAKCMVQL
ncbi:MAG: DEAD/DEAH box helicase family protein [Candidatus Paceibacterota bacterium]